MPTCIQQYVIAQLKFIYLKLTPGSLAYQKRFEFLQNSLQPDYASVLKQSMTVLLAGLKLHSHNMCA